jgi:uncharacterized membrane protein
MMERANKIMANAAFAIIVLLSFLLIFEQRLELPAWLQAFGRMHPLLLHLPIGLLLLTALLVFLRKYFESSSFDSMISFLLHLAVLMASLTALMGLFLSREGGYDDQELQLHKWFGVATCYVGAGLLIVQRKDKIFKASLLVSVGVLIITGHYGAMMTHGENFVLGPLQNQNPETQLTEDATVFEAVIEPLFERKCVSCHNETKAKGRLVLTSFDHIMKGGKSGQLWNVNDVTNTLLMKRLLLPMADKKHMPPKDKPQLTVAELNFVSMWLGSGADTQRKLGEYSDSDSIKQLGLKLIADNQQRKKSESIYHFDFVDSEKIAALNTPYRSVFQLAQTEPALHADFFVRQAFDKKNLEELKIVKEQWVSLSLAKMPITDEDLNLLMPFKNLEVLNLNNTDLTGKGFSDLQQLEQLHSLSLAGTKVTAQSMDVLKSFKSLKKVFIWNTTITAAEADVLRKKYPHILWETGYIPDAREVLQLSAPIMVNEPVLKPEESVVLKASLPGTIIRYTTDGSDPDSVSGILYEKPIPASSYQIIKSIAVKKGWRHSNQTEFVIFKAGVKPSRAELLTLPDQQYQGEGVQTFIDGKKGAPDFFRDPTWIAFRDRTLEAIFYFDDAPALQSITISFSKNAGAMTMPPAEVEVWGGEDAENITLLQKVKPVQPIDYSNSRVEGIEIKFPTAKRKCYKLIAKPLTKLPAFRKSNEKGWLMVDEIFFNE